jgi:hypothetical protein
MTIRHIVIWTMAADDAATRADQAAEVARRLRALRGVVPSIRALEASVNSVDVPGNADVVLIADFEDEAGLEAYQSHPQHKEVGAYIRSVTAARAAVDFAV